MGARSDCIQQVIVMMHEEGGQRRFESLYEVSIVSYFLYRVFRPGFCCIIKIE